MISNKRECESRVVNTPVDLFVFFNLRNKFNIEKGRVVCLFVCVWVGGCYKIIKSNNNSNNNNRLWWFLLFYGTHQVGNKYLRRRVNWCQNGSCEKWKRIWSGTWSIHLKYYTYRYVYLGCTHTHTQRERERERERTWKVKPCERGRGELVRLMGLG